MNSIIIHSMSVAWTLGECSLLPLRSIHRLELNASVICRSLAIDSMDSVDLTDDDNDRDEIDVPTLTETPVIQLTTCSAPSTPTGERDPPAAIRRSSITSTAGTTNDLPQIEVKYQGGNNITSVNSDDSAGLIDSFLGCFKPIFSAVNKFGENIRYHRDSISTTTTLSRPTDDWHIPIDSIMNDLILIGTGIEGTVYLGKLDGQNVACKRVRSEEETSIKHLKKLNHVNVVKFRGMFCMRWPSSSTSNTDCGTFFLQVFRCHHLCSTSSWNIALTVRYTMFWSGVEKEVLAQNPLKCWIGRGRFLMGSIIFIRIRSSIATWNHRIFWSRTTMSWKSPISAHRNRWTIDEVNLCPSMEHQLGWHQRWFDKSHARRRSTFGKRCSDWRTQMRIPSPWSFDEYPLSRFLRIPHFWLGHLVSLCGKS